MNLVAGATVTVVERDQITGYDEGNRPIYGEKRTPVEGVVCWPEDGSESTNAEDVVTDTLTAVFPWGTSIPSTAEVELPFGTYQVIGNAFPWQSPLTGTKVGVAAVLKVVK